MSNIENFQQRNQLNFDCKIQFHLLNHIINNTFNHCLIFPPIESKISAVSRLIIAPSRMISKITLYSFIFPLTFKIYFSNEWPLKGGRIICNLNPLFSFKDTLQNFAAMLRRAGAKIRRDNDIF